MTEPKVFTPTHKIVNLEVNGGMTVGQFLVCLVVLIPIIITLACVFTAVFAR